MKHNTLLTLAMAGMTAMTLCNCSSSNIKDVYVSDSQIRLDQANYRVVATQVKGEDKGFHLLSAFPTTIPTSLSALGDIMKLSADGGIAVTSASRAKAIENLYKNCGDLRNRPVALINLREEKSGVNLLIFSRPKVTITADLIEFVK